MRDKIFYLICFGFILGVLLRSLVLINFPIVAFLGLISVAFLLYFFISKSKRFLFLFVFLIAFSLGVIRFYLADRAISTNFENKVGGLIDLSGVLVDEPTMGEFNQKLTIEIGDNNEKTKVLATTNFGEIFKYGDEVKINGRLEKPTNFITDQGKNFDYINYLRKDNIIYIMSYPEIEIISHGNGNHTRSTLFAIKNKFLERINFAIPSPENLLLGGILLGERSAFSKDMREDFVRTGTIHIVALSGYNITIVAEWFMKLFAFLPLNFAIGAGMLAILLFVLMTGASSTALRAGIMAILALIARATGRNYDIARALILAGLAMIIFNPFLLVFDVSFELSFIATVAVIFFSPKIEKYFLWVTPRFGLRDIVSVTSAVYIFVLPFILYKMGNLSTVALPANILVLPLVPLSMILGFVTGFLGLIWSVLSLPFGFLTYSVLHFDLGVISMLSQLPFASFSIPNFPLLLTLLIYAYFIYLLFGRSIKHFFVKIED